MLGAPEHDVVIEAAEDTRHTRRLWQRHDIETRLVSYHAHSTDRRREELIERLRAGDSIALVSDAGAPLVSDPGDDLVAAWADARGSAVAIPGPSAVLAALVSSGIAPRRWGFEGFLPRKGRERKERLARIATDDRATVLFESPARTARTLHDLADACGEDRPSAICRELTKRYEEVVRGSLGELAEAISKRTMKGEIVIVVAGRTEMAGPVVSISEGRATVDALVDDGLPRSAAAKRVAADTGLPRRELFDRDPGAD